MFQCISMVHIYLYDSFCVNRVQRNIARDKHIVRVTIGPPSETLFCAYWGWGMLRNTYVDPSLAAKETYNQRSTLDKQATQEASITIEGMNM